MTSHDTRYFGPASILLGFAAFLFIGAAHGLGLGKLSVLSALDEPLIAEIELTSVDADVLDSLEVRLGSPEEFAQSGVPRETFLRTLEFSVVKGGIPKIRINTELPAREPFLHFLVRATWDDGNLLREYTALLDPPLYAESQPTAISSPGVAEEARTLAGAESSGQGVDSESDAQGVVYDPAATSAASATSGESFGAAFTGAEFGPTEEGDTLWSIASSLDTRGVDVNVFQIMIALLRENPEAFIDNNINRLKKGQILRISDPEAVGREEASRVYTAQLSEWESFRMEAAQATEVVMVPAQEASPEGSGASVADQVASADSEQVQAPEPDIAAAAATMEADAGAEQAPLAAAEEDLLKIVQASLNEEVDGTGTDTAAADSEAEEQLSAMRAKLSTLEESLVSAELQNEELRERVSLLEEQLTKAQRLVELESQELALAQEQAARQQEENLLLQQQLAEQQLEADEVPEDSAAAEPMVEPRATEEPLVASEEIEEPPLASEGTEMAAAGATEAVLDAPEGEVAETAAEVSQETPAVADEQIAAPSEATTVAIESAAVQTESEAAAEEQAAAPVKKTRVDTRQETEATPALGEPRKAAWWQSMLDSVLGNSISVMAAGAGAIALLGGLVLFVRRRRTLAEFEESILSGSGLDAQTESTDTASNKNTDTSFLSDFGMAGMGSMQADEVDPLAEAEVYLAYGRDEQAEEVLKEAAARHPDRHELKLKLLEIYKQRDDVKSFETMAEELYPAGGHGDHETWRKVVQMGVKVNPDNPLFSSNAPDAAAVMMAGPEAADESDAALPLEPAAEMSDIALPEDIVSKSTQPVDPSQHPFPQPQEPMEIDEEFDRLTEQMGFSEPSEITPASAPEETAADEDAEMMNFVSDERSQLDFDIDFNGIEEETAEQTADTSADAAPPRAEADHERSTMAQDMPELELTDMGESEMIDEPKLETNTLAGEDDEDIFAAAAPIEDESGVDDEALISLDTSELDDASAPMLSDEAESESEEEPVKEVTRNFGVVDGGGSSGDEAEAERWDEAATKLDLAQAYLNMGDKAGARSIIDEVMKEGSPAQRDQAAELQAQIG